MRLYHSTNIDFSEIDLAKSFPLKDFGYVYHLLKKEYKTGQLPQVN